MSDSNPLTFVELDVSRDKIAIALLRPGDQIPFEQTIASTEEAVRKQVRRWGNPATLRVCYEAGPTGYELQRQLADLGVDCVVIAPSLIPKRPGRRVKTDRRDARSLCGLLRAGELTAVRIPEPEQEVVRDLLRSREDLTEDILRSRHRLSKLLLRHGRVYREGSTWTERHFAWIRAQQFSSTRLAQLLAHHLVVLDSRLTQRAALDRDISEIARSEEYAPSVRRLSCLRGISELSALTLLVEVGDFQRFALGPCLHGIHRPGRPRVLQRRAAPAGCDHQDRQCALAADPARERRLRRPAHRTRPAHRLQRRDGRCNRTARVDVDPLSYALD